MLDGLDGVVGAMIRDEDVTVVERDRLDAHEDLSGTWLGNRAEVVESQFSWGGNLPCLVRHDGKVEYSSMEESKGIWPEARRLAFYTINPTEMMALARVQSFGRWLGKHRNSVFVLRGLAALCVVALKSTATWSARLCCGKFLGLGLVDAG